MDVAAIMSPEPISVPLDMPVHEARNLMENAGIRHLPVVAAGRLVAMVSDRDLYPDEAEFADARVGREGRLVADVLQARLSRVTPRDSTVTAAAECLRLGTGGLPVMDDDKLVGILSEMDLLMALTRSGGEGSPASVDDVMTAFPQVARPDTTVAQALATCQELRAHHLPVVDGDQLVGIVSDRDLLCSAAAGRAHEGTLGEVMQGDPITIEPGQSASKAAELMISAKISSLPVVEGGELVGILTLTDLLDQLLKSQGQTAGT